MTAVGQHSQQGILFQLLTQREDDDVGKAVVTVGTSTVGILGPDGTTYIIPVLALFPSHTHQ